MTAPTPPAGLSVEGRSRLMNFRRQGVWAEGCSLLTCGMTTGHFVRAIAFCDSPETASAIAALFDQYEDMLEALQDLMPTNLGSLPATMPDSSMLPLDVTFGEMRQAIAALAKATTK